MANKRGRTPKSLAEHKLENEKLYGAVAKRSETELQAEKIPTKPSDLSEMESDIWDYYQVVMDQYHVFSLINGPMLKMLVRLHYEHELVNREIDEKIMFGISFEEMTELFKIRDKHQGTMLKLYKQMGIGLMEVAKLGCLLGGLDRGKEDDDDPHGFF